MFKSIFLVCLLVAAVSVAEEQFIVGGEVAVEGDWGSQLALFHQKTFLCSATLLAPTFAVTSAKCIGDDVGNFSILAGSHSLKIHADSITRTLTTATRHSSFVDSRLLGYPGDIAFIAWDEPLEFGASVYPIRVKALRDRTGYNCYIAGWGATKSIQDLWTEKLREAKVERLEQVECRYSQTPILPSHVCVKGRRDKIHEDGGVAICRGDVGGPLVCQYAFKEWKLAGIASWGTPFCSTSSPSVFTDVSVYRSWLRRQAGKLEDGDEDDEEEEEGK